MQLTEERRILAEYPSKTKPGEVYRIMKPKSPKMEIYCTCWQWKMKRTCIHLEHYNTVLKHRPSSQFIPKVESDDNALAAAIAQAIGELS